ncbi:Uma2 family endonuclease [Algiphilus sp. W345]|uniref:Uma2 family endonuclease n=1 Tax=Banduia mediterranea TaxID=3075609 RepID=A0ABU2WLN6_9GAMM|nr:Uma2 family endonuclease [Algiphilus sp. W345]MDT0498798.1 Uma2 family endonuclease [Algiphilus sp. W345]
MGTPIRKDDRHYTYADYLKFPEDERWEIIDGVAYGMSPSPSDAHQSLSAEILAQVHAQLRGKQCHVRAAPFDVRFNSADTSDSIVQPDLLVVCDRSKITPAGLIGTPDWVVEILSPSTASTDQITKRALYERYGVPEYWLVHPVDRILTIYRLDAGARYGAADIRELGGQTEVAAVPGLEIDWDLWEPLFEPS